MHTLLLGSSSDSRQILLKEALIPFVMVGHNANEDEVEHTTLEETVLNIARLKMQHITMPEGKEGDVVFVLTADSMGCTADGTIHGKPKDKADAIEKIKQYRETSKTVTGYCIEKRGFKDGAWHTLDKRDGTESARCKFNVPDAWLDRYIEHSWAMKASGAVAIEFYGAQFLEWIDGSYSAVMGLPMFEVRQALDDLEFFSLNV